MNCDFSGGAESCRVCGWRRPPGMPATVRRNCSVDSAGRSTRNPTTCAHNVGAYDDYQAHAICGCSSNQKIALTAVHECKLHGDVTPLAKRTREGLKSCVGCSDFRQQATTAGTDSR